MNKNGRDHKLVISFDLIIEILFLVMVFLVPTIFDRRIGIVFSGTKVAWLRSLMAVTMSLWAIKLLIQRKHFFVRSPLDWPVVTFLLTTTIATLTSVHVYTSFVGFYGRYEGLSTWYIFGLLFFIAINFLYSSQQIRRVLAVVLSSATVMSVYGVIQRSEIDPYQWGGVVTWQRVIGTIGQPNFLAAYILMAFFLGLILYLRDSNVKSDQVDWLQQSLISGSFVITQALFILMIYRLDAGDVLAWYLSFALMTAATLYFAFNLERLTPLINSLLTGVSLLLIYICLLFTQSRGGYMGLFTGGALFALLIGRDWLFQRWRKLGLLGLLILAISLFTMLQPQYSPFARFTSEITVKGGDQVVSDNSRLELKGAAGSRGETWKSAFKVIADNPLFGVGPEVLKMVFPRYETDLFRFKEAFHVKQDRCHNETFDVPVTKGLIAFFVYLWLIVTLFKTGLDKLPRANADQRLLIAGILAACLAYLIQNQFSFGVVAITSLFWVMWGLVMRVGGEDTNPTGQEAVQLQPDKIPWLPVSAVLVVAAIIIYFSFFSFRADLYFKSGKNYLDMRQIPLAVEEFTRSMAVYPLEGVTVSHLGIAYLNLGNVNEAVKTLNYGLVVDPYNADNFHMLSRLYLSLYERGDKAGLAQAKKLATIAVTIDPYYAEGFQTLGIIAERQGEPKTAVKMYIRAFMINPNLLEAMLQMERLVAPAEAAGYYEAAYKKYSDNVVVLGKIGEIYLKRGDLAKVNKIAEQMRQLDSHNPQGYMIGAEVAMRQGNLKTAFDLLQQVVLIDPQNKTAHRGLSLVYAKMGMIDRAQEEAELAK